MPSWSNKISRETPRNCASSISLFNRSASANSTWSIKAKNSTCSSVVSVSSCNLTFNSWYRCRIGIGKPWLICCSSSVSRLGRLGALRCARSRFNWKANCSILRSVWKTEFFGDETSPFDATCLWTRQDRSPQQKLGFSTWLAYRGNKTGITQIKRILICVIPVNA